MKIEVKCTEADFREANAQAVIRHKPKLDIIDVVLFVILSGGIFAVLTETDLIGTSLQQQRTAPRDLLLLLGPGILSGLILILMMMGALASQLRRARKRAPFASPDAAAGSGRWGRLVAMLVVVAIAAVI